MPTTDTDPTTARTDPEASLWNERNLANPHTADDKPERVRGMFAAIAGRYDLNNRLHSGWRDQAWRRYAVRTAQVRPGEVVLDVACGTGDLTQAFATRTDAARVIGLDFTREMLNLAERKRMRAGLHDGRILYIEGDAQRLPLDDASVDVVSIAFGIRNVRDPEVTVAEFARVLRPGGRLVILEFDRPRLAPVRWANRFYAGWLMPRTATLISRDRSGAYLYLPKSVDTFLTREQMVSLMTASGFSDVTVRNLTMGICACYRGVRTSG